MGKETHQYEIGGVIVDMTEDQAERWNRGETTDYDLRTIQVWKPDTLNMQGRVVQVGHPITLRRATNDRLEPQYSSFMTGSEARRCD